MATGIRSAAIADTDKTNGNTNPEGIAVKEMMTRDLLMQGSLLQCPNRTTKVNASRLAKGKTQQHFRIAIEEG